MYEIAFSASLLLKEFMVVLYPFLLLLQLFFTEMSAKSLSAVNFLQIEEAWARATTIGNSVVYVKIFNNSSQSDRLINVETDVCKVVELHTHLKEGGIYKMRRLKAIEIPAKQVISLEEGGLHIMLMNIFEPLKEGTEIKLILVFEKAGRVPILAKVRKNKSKCGCKD